MRARVVGSAPDESRTSLNAFLFRCQTCIAAPRRPASRPRPTGASNKGCVFCLGRVAGLFKPRKAPARRGVKPGPTPGLGPFDDGALACVCLVKMDAGVARGREQVLGMTPSFGGWERSKDFSRCLSDRAVACVCSVKMDAGVARGRERVLGMTPSLGGWERSKDFSRCLSDHGVAWAIGRRAAKPPHARPPRPAASQPALRIAPRCSCGSPPRSASA